MSHLQQRCSLHLEFLCAAPLHYRARRIQMDQQPSTLISVLATAAVQARTSLVNFLRTQIAVDVRTYRPEKYYMRGPGPKWREKHVRGHLCAPVSYTHLTLPTNREV